VVALACATPRGAIRGAPPGPADVDMYARLLRMADMRALDTALVRQAIASRSPALRVDAVRAIGQVHGAAMIPELRGLLDDRDSAVAATAAFSLGLLHDTASVAALGATLPHAPTVGAAAAWALGQMGTAAAPTITAALGRPGADSTVTGALLLAASRLHPVPAKPVMAWLAARDPGLRWRAVYAFARSYQAAGVRPLLAVVHDSSALVRAQVARGLAFRAAGDSLADAAIAALDSLAVDAEPHVRVNAIRSLAGYGVRARARVVAALHDANANVRLTAAQSLASVLNADRRAWLAAWQADTAFAYRAAILASAMHLDVVLPAADNDNPDGWRHQSDWRYRAAVAAAGARAPSIERMRQIALPLSNDPDPRVRMSGYEAMAPHADTAQEHPWRRAFMYFGMHDRDPYVRGLCIESLVHHATAAEVPRVLLSLQLAANDTVPDARIAVAHFLASAWRHDSAAFGDSLIAAIRALPVPADPLVRDAAGDVSLLAAWRAAPPAPAPHPLAWYADRVRALVLPALRGTLPHVTLETVRGAIELELYAADAPLTVENFLTLARSGYYTGIAFHRVVPDFVAQDGDHRGDGNGAPSWTIRDELNRRLYDRGAVGMALSGPNTGGSQYFITLSPQPHLDGGYTVFGHVVSGYAALDALVQGDSLRSVSVR
jgi:cyclophilin family peptidyl-prolyl cis-trans isomerase/HEAT repeat protein